AAGALARGGAGVLVVEKTRFPRPKICGEFLSYEALPALDRLGALQAVRAACPETIESFSLVRQDGRTISSRLPAPVLSLSRERRPSRRPRRAARVRRGLPRPLASGGRRGQPRGARHARPREGGPSRLRRAPDAALRGERRARGGPRRADSGARARPPLRAG